MCLQPSCPRSGTAVCRSRLSALQLGCIRHSCSIPGRHCSLHHTYYPAGKRSRFASAVSQRDTVCAVLPPHAPNVTTGSCTRGRTQRLRLASCTVSPEPSTIRFGSSSNRRDGGVIMTAASTWQPSTEELGEDAVVWSSQHGLVVGASPPAADVGVVHAPISVLPTPFPAASFHKACDAMTAFNSLIAAVAADSEYLQQTLAPAAQYDDFTAKLLEVHRRTEDLRQAGKIERIQLAVNRSDYMLDEPSNTLMQVELNTIASSFGPLSALVSRMHRYTVARSSRGDIAESQLPENLATEGIADALALAAHEAVDADGVVLMIVQPGEKNSYDQQWVQTGLWEQHGVRTVRRSLEDIAQDSIAQLGDDGSLTVDGHKIGAIYLRAGYSPDDYPTEQHWEAREKLERSAVAKCPSVAYQLSGAKKIQQDLARPGVLERFVSKPEDAELLRACFAGLWSLDDLEDPDTADVLRQVVTSPDAYVLKPQREGGGNNLYGQAAAEKIAAGTGLAAYILMQRIRPPINRTAMVREGKVVEVDTLSELGIFGSYVSKDGEVLLNAQAGHLLRTKAATSDEGGVAAGFAVLDSPYLTE